MEVCLIYGHSMAFLLWTGTCLMGKGLLRNGEEVHAVMKIALFCCSKVTQKLGCSSAQCLYDVKNRVGAFGRYARDIQVELVGVVNCPGCPSQIAPYRIIAQIENLADFQVEAIHFTNCISTFCAFHENYRLLIERNYPELEVILGTTPHFTHAQVELVSTNN